MELLELSTCRCSVELFSRLVTGAEVGRDRRMGRKLLPFPNGLAGSAPVDVSLSLSQATVFSQGSTMAEIL